MSGAFSARCIAHRVLCIVLSGVCFLSRVLCAAPSASRITPFALRFLPSASRITFSASRSPHTTPPGKPTETDSKPLTRLR
jgi:hypothetical protein